MTFITSFIYDNVETNCMLFVDQNNIRVVIP